MPIQTTQCPTVTDALKFDGYSGDQSGQDKVERSRLRYGNAVLPRSQIVQLDIVEPAAVINGEGPAKSAVCLVAVWPANGGKRGIDAAARRARLIGEARALIKIEKIGRAHV